MVCSDLNHYTTSTQKCGAIVLNPSPSLVPWGLILETFSDFPQVELLPLRVTPIRSLYPFPSTLCSRFPELQNSLRKRPSLLPGSAETLCYIHHLISRADHALSTVHTPSTKSCSRGSLVGHDVRISVSQCRIELGIGREGVA